MTREEAIERFENVKANALVQKASGVSEYWQNEINGTIEAIDMAIEALQNEQMWIPFKKRPLTDEEREEYPDWAYIFDCPLPEDEEEILLTNGFHVWTDTFINDVECYLDGGDDIDEGMAWMPLPTPYKGGENE